MGPFRYGTALRTPVSWNGEQALIGTVDELMVALDVLNRQHDREILQQLTPVLGDLIAAGDRSSSANLKLLLKSLSAADRLFVVAALRRRMAALIGSATELRNLIVSLTDLEVEAAILRAIGQTDLRRLVVRSQQLWEILEWLYGDSDTLLLELLGAPWLRRLIAHGHDLAEVVRRVDPDRQVPTLEMLGWDFVLDLIRDDVDLRELFSALCTPACAELLERLPVTRIVDLAGSEVGWYELGRRLSPSKTALLLEKLGRKSGAP